MAIKNIFIHIGMPKTGTSSIQETLFYNHKLLEQNNYKFETSNDGDQGAFLFQMFCVNIALLQHYNQLRNTVRFSKIEGMSNLEYLQMLLVNCDCENYIFSAEDLSLLDIESIKYFRDFLKESLVDVNLKIVVYVRNPVNYLISSYQQISMTCDITTTNNAMESYKANTFSTVLEKYIEVFGKEQVKIYKFEEAIDSSEGLVGHFFSEIGVKKEIIDQLNLYTSNESRCIEVVEILQYINNELPFSINEHYPQNPPRISGDFLTFYKVQGVKFSIPFEKKKEFYEGSKQSSEWLKNNTGIDYTKDTIEDNYKPAEYSMETLNDFIAIFPTLTNPLKKLYLDFFRQKHKETHDDKFLLLFDKNSAPSIIFKFSKRFAKDIKKNLSQYSYPGVNFLYMKDIFRYFAQIFVDAGTGFSHENS